jgi:pyruvate formate lyase activating enzyme
VASTLLIPGYVEMEEVAKIATFIASLNPGIPYALLAFYPHFFMSDLPTTSRRHAQECLQVAKEAGLNNVRVGNIHLLGGDY